MPEQAAPPAPIPDDEPVAQGRALASSPEYRSYKRAVERGNVSFHQVASAWFDWHWGPDECDNCEGSGWLPPPSKSTNGATASLRHRCKNCRGRGSWHENPDDA